MKTHKPVHETDFQVCQRLHALRKQHGLTQERIAEAIDVTTRYYGQIERGERPLTLSIAGRLCQLFHVTYDYLYLGTLAEDSITQTCIDPTTSRGALLGLVRSATPQECDAYLALIKAAWQLKEATKNR